MGTTLSDITVSYTWLNHPSQNGAFRGRVNDNGREDSATFLVDFADLDDFIDLCARTARSPHWTLDDIVKQLRHRSDTGQFDDDCTLVRLTAR